MDVRGTPDLHETFGRELPFINNMGAQQFDPNWSTHEHSTAACELLHVIEGKTTLVTPTARLVAGPGDTLVMPSRTPHLDDFPPDQDINIFMVQFTWSLEAEYFKQVDTTVPLDLSAQCQTELGLLFDGLRGDIRGSDDQDRLIARARVLTILLLIMRDKRRSNENSDATRKANAAIDKQHSGLIEQAKDFMQHHLDEVITLEDIAAHVGVSTYHLSHVFGRASDFTVYGYLTTLRMEKARALLSEGKLNVSETAYAVGYKDPRYFSRAFRKLFGQYPSDIKPT